MYASLLVLCLRVIKYHICHTLKLRRCPWTSPASLSILIRFPSKTGSWGERRAILSWTRAPKGDSQGGKLHNSSPNTNPTSASWRIFWLNPIQSKKQSQGSTCVSQVLQWKERLYLGRGFKCRGGEITINFACQKSITNVLTFLSLSLSLTLWLKK